jgi:hypothetical protein
LKTILSCVCALFAAGVLLAPSAHAGLIGNVTISELYPDDSTVYGTDTVAVGSSLSCPGASALCTSGYFGQPATFSITGNTISLTEDCCTAYTGATFNGYSFTNLVFAGGASLVDVILSSSQMPGISQSDVTFTASSIFINLQGVGAGVDDVPGVFTLTLVDSGSRVPEPASVALMTAGIGGLWLLARRRRNV